MVDIKREVEKRSNYMIRLRKHFHKYPEIGMKEYETSKRIQEELKNMDIPYILVGETGVIGFLGSGEKVIALRADMDALKVQEETEVAYKSTIPGVMHACGHDAHMAALLGAADIIKKYEQELDCTVKLIFQPSEENCKGAKMICDEGHIDDVDEIFGLHVFTDIPCGQISIESGPRMAASDIFRIKIEGKSGHAGKPQQCVDSILIGSACVMNLQSIISREMDPTSSAVLSIGQFHSGAQHNIISGETFIEGTVRTFDMMDAKHIEESLKRIVYNTAVLFQGKAHVNYMRSLHPIVMNDEEVTKKALRAAKKVLPESMFVHAPRMFLGEDFSSYQQRVKGTFAFVGAGNESMGRAYPNHHNCFNIDKKAILYSAMLYASFALEKETI